MHVMQNMVFIGAIIVSASSTLIPLWQNTASRYQNKIEQCLTQGMHHMKNMMHQLEAKKTTRPPGFEFENIEGVYHATQTYPPSQLEVLLQTHTIQETQRTLWYWSYNHDVYPILQYIRFVSWFLRTLKSNFKDFFKKGVNDLLLKPLLYSASSLQRLVCLSEHTVRMIEASHPDTHGLQENFVKIDACCDKTLRFLVEIMTTLTHHFCKYATMDASTVDDHLDKHLYDLFIQPKRGLPWIKANFLTHTSNLMERFCQQRKQRSWHKWFVCLGALLVLAVLSYCLLMTHLVTLSHKSIYISMALIIICTAIILYQVYRLWCTHHTQTVNDCLQALMDGVVQTSTGPHYHAGISSCMSRQHVKAPKQQASAKPMKPLMSGDFMSLARDVHPPLGEVSYPEICLTNRWLLDG